MSKLTWGGTATADSESPKSREPGSSWIEFLGFDWFVDTYEFLGAEDVVEGQLKAFTADVEDDAVRGQKNVSVFYFLRRAIGEKDKESW